MGNKSHLKLLCDAGEMFALLSEGSDTETILQRCVLLVGKHLRAEVCSIYLLENSSNELVLRATTGLNPDSVGIVKMSVGEGLVGKAMETKEMILEDNASKNPDFKYFPSANEEAFECFLAIPIVRGRQGTGVMVVQRRANLKFSNEEAMVLRSIASQLAVLIENARLLLNLKDEESIDKTEQNKTLSLLNEKRKLELPRILPAQIASRGIFVGKAMLNSQNPLLEMLRSSEDTHYDPSLGIKELDLAIKRTIKQIESLEQEIARRLPEAVALIFDAHIMILKDKNFSVKMKELTLNGTSALSAVINVAKKYIDLFASSPNEYIRAKVADVEDISIRLLKNLLNAGKKSSEGHEGKILVARDLLPSEAVKFSMKGISGIILTGGGIASHSAILARSLGIPMLITEESDAEKFDILAIPEETKIIMDAEVGNIYFNPAPEIEAEFLTRLESDKINENIPAKETFTDDKVSVDLMVNINLLSELDSAVIMNAAGVGLYRSEFPFLVRNSFPSDAEQTRIYSILFSKMAGKEVTIRTLDIGGDKMVDYLDNGDEANPELGLRSIRFALRHPDIMEQQLMAILMASADADPKVNLRIMFPMISSIDEFRWAKKMVISCCEKLNGGDGIELNDNEQPGNEKADNGKTGSEKPDSGKTGSEKPDNEKADSGKTGNEKPDSEKIKIPKIGMMLELPSVVEIIDDLAKEADFFSIGTNDFVQYMLAADRTNERVAQYYAPHHPGVLRSLKRIADSVTRSGKDISVCGEMAKEKAFIPFFLGIGIRKLSVNKQFLFETQKCISSWNIEDAKQYAQELLAENSVKGVLDLLNSDHIDKAQNRC
ncbi:Pdp [Desulfamplus magnetovallimortis]|uniref:Pdp n=1 Tax=Desulfamplus magnetovallimortis TaxID=1246637 RepID=A0A1W1H760_9BACT|nr:putative PEP-binding protein [Desulfamplus magnetovallimortis]SLM28225.1 Pdp [Desulfamplus magnetovallimortis]